MTSPSLEQRLSTEEVSSLRPKRALSEVALRPTRAEIDLSALAHNYRELRGWLSPCKVLAVVKADGYGHGAVEVAKTLQRTGAYGFGVALAEEGFELRESGVRGEIFVLNGVYGSAHRRVLEAGMTPIVYSVQEAAAFVRASAPRPAKLHLKVDTGMGRLGVPHRELNRFLEQIGGLPGVRFTGVLTHLAASDSDSVFTAVQLSRLRNAVEQVRAAGHPVGCVHAANSGALAEADWRFDLVRPGLAIYGVAPKNWQRGSVAQACAPELRFAMRLRSEIVAVQELRKGETSGYDRSFVAEHDSTRIAIAPVGYGDGLLWRSSTGVGSGVREVLINGQRCPIAGRVSMDLTAIDVTACSRATVGDEVLLLGRQGEHEVSIQEVAKAADTISYEVLTNISRRVPRIYHW